VSNPFNIVLSAITSVYLQPSTDKSSYNRGAEKAEDFPGEVRRQEVRDGVCKKRAQAHNAVNYASFIDLKKAAEPRSAIV
jgi:hypothetical protein